MIWYCKGLFCFTQLFCSLPIFSLYCWVRCTKLLWKSSSTFVHSPCIFSWNETVNMTRKVSFGGFFFLFFCFFYSAFIPCQKNIKSLPYIQYAFLIFPPSYTSLFLHFIFALLLSLVYKELSRLTWVLTSQLIGSQQTIQYFHGFLN